MWSNNIIYVGERYLSNGWISERYTTYYEDGKTADNEYAPYDVAIAQAEIGVADFTSDKLDSDPNFHEFQRLKEQVKMLARLPETIYRFDPKKRIESLKKQKSYRNKLVYSVQQRQISWTP